VEQSGEIRERGGSTLARIPSLSLKTVRRLRS